MPRITAQRQQDRYDAILEAARTVLADRGYEAASIGEIARQAGISEGLIYRYFDNKRDLLMAVLGQFYLRVINGLQNAVVRKQTFRERLRILIKKHLEAFSSDTELCRLFLTEVRVASDYRGSEIYRLNRRYTSILLGVIQDGIAEGVVRADVDPRMLRDMLFGGIEHFVWRHIDNRSSAIPKGESRIANILLDGVCRSGK